MSEEKNEDMTNENQDATIGGENGVDSGSAAGTEPAEDTLDAYKTLAKELADQNKALMDNQKSLQDQISVLIRNGASINDDVSSSNGVSRTDDSGVSDSGEPYVSLKDLGTELGKRDYRNENMKRE